MQSSSFYRLSSCKYNVLLPHIFRFNYFLVFFCAQVTLNFLFYLFAFFSLQRVQMLRYNMYLRARCNILLEIKIIQENKVYT